MTIDLREMLEYRFDPSNSNQAMELAKASVKLCRIAASIASGRDLGYQMNAVEGKQLTEAVLNVMKIFKFKPQKSTIDMLVGGKDD